MTTDMAFFLLSFPLDCVSRLAPSYFRLPSLSSPPSLNFTFLLNALCARQSLKTFLFLSLSLALSSKWKSISQNELHAFKQISIRQIIKGFARVSLFASVLAPASFYYYCCTHITTTADKSAQLLPVFSSSGKEEKVNE